MGKSVQHPLSSSSSSSKSVTNKRKICHTSSSSNPGRLFQLKKHAQSDHITKLPNEILCDIISHLTFAEAARTCVLARRWNKLWHHFRGALEFDDTKKIEVLPENKLKQAVHSYLGSNRQVLELLQSLSFGSFKVLCYNMDKSCESHLDFCVQFAMKKRLSSFDLDTSPKYLLFETVRQYNFPPEFYAWIKEARGLENISSLMSISLNLVNVSDNLSQHLLVNCPLLESLCVRESKELFNPKFIGGTLKLKYLEVLSFCLESIEISAPNLLTLIARIYCKSNSKFKMLIKNAPKLVELCVPVHTLNSSPESVSSYLPHLERQTWYFTGGNSRWDTYLIRRFVEQKKLRQLTWRLGTYHDDYTIKLNSLLKASPFLQKFTLVIVGGWPTIDHEERAPAAVTAKHPHRCLKVLQIDGFTGADAEVKLVRYIIENTSSLEEIIIDTIDPLDRGTPDKGFSSDLRRSKSRARKLRQYLPRGVSLVILEE